MNTQPKEQAIQTPSHEHNQPDKLCLRNVSLSFENKQILQDISFNILATGITCLIGPSGAGKSSLLRCLNLLHDHWQGDISVDNTSIRDWFGGGDKLRQEIGLIAQKPSVFPTSIINNVTFGLSRKQQKGNLENQVEEALVQAALWDEVKDRLHQSATTLSVGQQQRLCLARALVLKPSILLLDEPTASLDPRSKQLIETSLHQLALSMPILCVTHDLEQASRLQGQIVFMCDGKVIETGNYNDFFAQPQKLETREFLQWSVCDCD
ncbi:MAG: ATP-binding cassette domain-containing protein [Ghiorsea sp.]